MIDYPQLDVPQALDPETRPCLAGYSGVVRFKCARTRHGEVLHRTWDGFEWDSPDVILRQLGHTLPTATECYTPEGSCLTDWLAICDDLAKRYTEHQERWRAEARYIPFPLAKTPVFVATGTDSIPISIFTATSTDDFVLELIAHMSKPL